MASGRHQHHITGILLAAGVGARYDPSGRAFKLLARADPSRTLIQASAQRLAAAVDELLVVHGPRSLESYPAIRDLKARQYSCIQARDGMGRSLQSAIDCSCPETGWLVALADMPYIAGSTYLALTQALRGGALLARPLYQGRPGHPVALAARLRPDLMALPAEQGAGKLFRQFQGRAVSIPTDDPGCVADIDTPDALRQFADTQLRQ